MSIRMPQRLRDAVRSQLSGSTRSPSRCDPSLGGRGPCDIRHECICSWVSGGGGIRQIPGGDEHSGEGDILCLSHLGEAFKRYGGGYPRVVRSRPIVVTLRCLLPVATLPRKGQGPCTVRHKYVCLRGGGGIIRQIPGGNEHGGEGDLLWAQCYIRVLSTLLKPEKGVRTFSQS